jgi:hypothetical protein
MGKKESMIKKINELVIPDFPIINSIHLTGLDIDGKFINYKFEVLINISDFKKYVSSSDLFLDLILDKSDNTIDSYWLNKYKTDNFNWIEIRESIKSVCKFYYNERIQNFVVKLRII